MPEPRELGSERGDVCLQRADPGLEVAVGSVGSPRRAAGAGAGSAGAAGAGAGQAGATGVRRGRADRLAGSAVRRAPEQLLEAILLLPRTAPQPPHVTPVGQHREHALDL